MDTLIQHQSAGPRFGGGSRQFWRVARYVTPSRLNLLLRVRTAAGLPISRGRFTAMGLPDDAIEAILRHVWSLAAWDLAWTWGAQRFLGESRRHATAQRMREAAHARQHAALCYHAATIGIVEGEKKLRTLRAARTTLFSQALPVVMPTVRRVEIVWRATLLPGYFAPPTAAPTPAPLIVLLNGSTTAKEETLCWIAPLLAEGLAVLCLDWPGTGETALERSITADCDDITDGLLAFARAEPGLTPDQIILLGFSLGGAIALRAAAADPRIAAVITVTVPYDAARWLPVASPVMIQHLQSVAGSALAVPDLVGEFSVADLIPALTCPLLVIGAGADLLVPPAEAIRLAAAAGDRATLLWYPDEGHGLYDAIPDWLRAAGRWARAVVASQSTPVDRAGPVSDPPRAPAPGAIASAAGLTELP